MPADWTRTVKCGKYDAVFYPDHPRAWSTGFVYAYRAKMEETLRRPLLPTEVVHHADGDGHNNSAKNLVLVPTQKDHWKLHLRAAKKAELVCSSCSRAFSREARQLHKNNIKNFCSRICYWASLRK